MTTEQSYFYEEYIDLPIKCPDDTAGFAIDIGSSLFKLAYVVGATENVTKLCCVTFEGTQTDEALGYLKEKVLPIVAKAGKKFAQGCGLGVVINRKKIKQAVGSRIDETSEHACVSKAFHFCMNNISPDKFVHNITELHLHKNLSSKAAVPVGVPHSGSKWVYKPQLAEQEEKETVVENIDLTHPVSTGVPSGGAHWINRDIGGSTCGEENGRTTPPSGERRSPSPAIFQPSDRPYIVCNLGSQFIYYLVDSDGIGTIINRSERGGLYYHALGTLLTKAKNFKELKAIAQKGSISTSSRCLQELPDECHAHFDLACVEEIEKLTHCAVLTDPFSKVITDGITDISKEDMARTLHATLCKEVLNNANILARLYKVKNVYYTGNFIRDNQEFEHHIQMSPVMDKMLQNYMTAKSSFVKYCGYMGAIGSILIGIERVQHGW